MTAPVRGRGFTLIELVIVICIAGLTIPVLMTGFATVATQTVKSESLADAALYSSQMLDEITTKQFVDPDDQNNTALGPNTGETYPDFDDVDDYNGYVRTNGQYTTSVSVTYAALNNGVWQASGSPTDYKMVTVTTKNTRIGLSSSMTAIVAD